MEANVSDELIEAMARIIDPSSWRVMDGYLAQMLRKYKGEHIGYDPDAFKHKESMAIARALLPVIRAHLEPTSEMVEAVEVERSLLAESSQFLSDVYNLLCPIKSEWEQAGMWTEFDEAVFNKRADLNLRIQDAIRSNTNG